MTYKLFFVNAIITVGICIPLSFLLRDKPPTPPSGSSEIDREEFCSSIKNLLKNKNYIICAIAYSVILGASDGHSSTMSMVILPFGFNKTDTAIVLTAPALPGIIGAALGSIYLAKTKRYKFLISVAIICSIATIFFCLPILFLKSRTLLIINSCLEGFVGYQIYGFFLELVCEISFPVGEGSAVGYIEALADFVTFIMGYLFSWIADQSTQIHSLFTIVILCGFLAIGLVIFQCTKEDLRKLKADAEGVEKPFIPLENVKAESK